MLNLSPRVVGGRSTSYWCSGERRGGPTEWGDVRKVITSGISSFAKKFCVAGGADEKLISIADLYRRFLGGGG